MGCGGGREDNQIWEEVNKRLLPMGLLQWGAILGVPKIRSLGIEEALGLGGKAQKKGTRVGETCHEQTTSPPDETWSPRRGQYPKKPRRERSGKMKSTLVDRDGWDQRGSIVLLPHLQH